MSKREGILGDLKEELSEVKDILTLKSVLGYGTGEGTNTVERELTKYDSGLPVLMGVERGKNPVVVDLQDNPVVSILGGSGSGKSWLLNTMLMGMFLTNSPEDLKVYIMDRKNSIDTQYFTSYPHTIKSVQDQRLYTEVLEEVLELAEERKKIIEKAEQETIEKYREQLIINEDTEGLKEVPNVVVVVEELAGVNSELNKKEKEQLSELLNEVAVKSGTLGIYLIVISQSADDLGKGLINNTRIHAMFKTNIDKDYKTFLGVDVVDKDKPKYLGEYLLKKSDEEDIKQVLGLGIGTSIQDDIEKVRDKWKDSVGG